jgi:hypothetical protein
VSCWQGCVGGSSASVNCPRWSGVPRQRVLGGIVARIAEPHDTPYAVKVNPQDGEATMIRSRTLPSTLHSTVALVSGVNQEYSALDGCCYGCEAWWRGSPGRSLSTKVCSADLLAARQRRILHHPGRVPRRLAPRRHGGVQRTHRGSFQRLRQRPKLRSDGQRHCAILPTKGY